ncbi:MAG: hypothetical protein AB1Z98_02500 [Nannocystaceae bacterium]
MTNTPPPPWPHQGYPQPPHGQQPGQPHPGPHQGYPQPPHGQQPGQPHPGYGQPHPGPHQGYAPQPGQPHPGYGPQPGQPYPGQPHPGYAPPPGQAWAHVPRHAAQPQLSSSGGSVLKIIFGVGLTLILGVALLHNSHEGFESLEGFITTALFCMFLGGALLMVLSGIGGAANKAVPKKLLLGLPIGAALLMLGAGPFISTAYCTMDERQRWDELDGAMDSDPLFFSGRWVIEYEGQVDDKFRRPEWHARWMLARAKENIDAKDAAALRTILGEIAQASDPSMYGDAEKAASEAFTAYYDAAKAKMYAPTDDGAAREFPVDERLRGAFATVLEELTHAPQANVYIAFRNDVDLTPPPGSDDLLEDYRADPGAKAAYPDGAPVIEAQASFTPAYDSRRRQTFMAAMSESFGQVFDAELLTLVPLEEGASREGKIVIEVSSHIVRLPKFFFWEKEIEGMPGQMRVAGLLFGIAVDWELHVFAADGRELYAQPPVRSEPAGSVQVSTQPGDPDWGMYSVLMDSAYYNYSRQVTGMFGLAPPAERTVFVYQGV